MNKKELQNKILIVEDDTTLRENISDFLITEGFLTDYAVDGVEGLEKIRKFLPDLVLCDIALPKMNGFELLQTIRNDELLNDIPFIFLTAMTGIDDFKTGMKLGAEDYITKPFDFDKLITTIKTRIKKQTEYKTSTEKKYRSLIENSLTGVFILQSGKIIYSNPKFRDIFQLESDENLEIKDIIHKDYLLTLNNYIVDCLKNKIDDFNFELKALRKDGNEIFIQIYGGRSKYENRPAILCNVLDITARKVAEERIKKSEKRYRELLNTVPAGIIELDKYGNIQYVNFEFLNITEYRLTEILKKNILDIIPRNAVYYETKKILENIFIKEIEATPLYLEIIRKNGNLRKLEARWDYIKDFEGKITGLIVALIDVTEREKSRAELIKSEERFRTLMNISSEFIWEINENGIYSFVSEKIFDILNYTNEEIIGINYLDLISPKDLDKVQKHLNSIYNKKLPFIIFEATYISKNSDNVTLQNTCIPIYNERGNIAGIRGASRSIKDLKESKEKCLILDKIFGILLSNTDSIVLFHDETELINLSLDEKSFLGYPATNFKEKNKFLYTIIHPEDKKNVVTKLEDWKISSDNTLKQIYRCKTSSGKYRLIEDIRNKIVIDNKFKMTVVILKDITEKSISEEEIIIQNIPYGILLTDNKGKILFANSKALNDLGLSVNEITGKNYFDIIFSADIFNKSEIHKDLQKKGYWKSKSKIRNVSEQIYEVCIYDVKNNESSLNNQIIIFFESDDSTNEKDINELKNKLENYIKFESKFISKLSHDIRSPINTIIGYTELMKEKNQIKENDVFINKILNSAFGIADRLDKFLKLIQLKTLDEDIKPEKVDLIETMEKNIEEFKDQFSKNKITVKTIKKAESVFINANKTLINQLFYTLFLNLQEHSKMGEIIINIESNSNNDNQIAIVRITTTSIDLSSTLNNLTKIKHSNEDINELIDKDKSELDFILIDRIAKIHNATLNVEYLNNEYINLTFVFPTVSSSN